MSLQLDTCPDACAETCVQSSCAGTHGLHERDRPHACNLRSTGTCASCPGSSAHTAGMQSAAFQLSSQHCATTSPGSLCRTQRRKSPQRVGDVLGVGLVHARGGLRRARAQQRVAWVAAQLGERPHYVGHVARRQLTRPRSWHASTTHAQLCKAKGRVLVHHAT